MTLINADAIEHGVGYDTFKLRDFELSLLRDMVFDSYISVIKMNLGVDCKPFYNIGIDRYHTLSERIEHKSTWNKINRILPPSDVEQIKNLSVYKALKKCFGDKCFVSGEEGIGWEEVYWRLIRPGSEDISPVHADSWFWELGHGAIPKNYKRVKVWIPLYNEAGLNGLQVLPFSQVNNQFSYKGVFVDGMIKPRIVSMPSKSKMKVVNTQDGEALIFHDNLIHGGAINTSDKTRVSLEFTFCFHGMSD